MKKKHNKFSNTAEYLDNLLSEALDEVADDLTEATENVDLYKEKLLNNATGIDQYANLHNDSLRIKGLVRDKQLKLLQMIKDRVEKTNSKNTSDGNSSSQESMIAAAEDAAKVIRREMREAKMKNSGETLPVEEDEETSEE